MLLYRRKTIDEEKILAKDIFDKGLSIKVRGARKTIAEYNTQSNIWALKNFRLPDRVLPNIIV